MESCTLEDSNEDQMVDLTNLEKLDYVVLDHLKGLQFKLPNQLDKFICRNWEDDPQPTLDSMPQTLRAVNLRYRDITEDHVNVISSLEHVRAVDIYSPTVCLEPGRNWEDDARDLLEPRNLQCLVLGGELISGRYEFFATWMQTHCKVDVFDLEFFKNWEVSDEDTN